MSDIIELSSLDFNDDFKINSSGLKSTNFGGGIELLMNDKIKEGTRPSSDIDIEDLNNLENELNNLSDMNIKNTFSAKSDLFNSNSSNNFSNDNLNEGGDNEKHFVRFDETPNIAQFTAETSDDKKTWDGYGKFNNIPINPDKTPTASQPQLSKEELLREKFKFLRKLETLEKFYKYN